MSVLENTYNEVHTAVGRIAPANVKLKWTKNKYLRGQARFRRNSKGTAYVLAMSVRHFGKDAKPSIQFYVTMVHEYAHIVLYNRGDLNHTHGKLWQDTYKDCATKFAKYLRTIDVDMAVKFIAAYSADITRYSDTGRRRKTTTRKTTSGKVVTKYTLECTSCGFNMNVKRLGKNIKLALRGEIPHRPTKHSETCTATLKAYRNW